MQPTAACPRCPSERCESPSTLGRPDARAGAEAAAAPALGQGPSGGSPGQAWPCQAEQPVCPPTAPPRVSSVWDASANCPPTAGWPLDDRIGLPSLSHVSTSEQHTRAPRPAARPSWLHSRHPSGSRRGALGQQRRSPPAPQRLRKPCARLESSAQRLSTALSDSTLRHHEPACVQRACPCLAQAASHAPVCPNTHFPTTPAHQLNARSTRRTHLTGKPPTHRRACRAGEEDRALRAPTVASWPPCHRPSRVRSPQQPLSCTPAHCERCSCRRHPSVPAKSLWLAARSAEHQRPAPQCCAIGSRALARASVAAARGRSRARGDARARRGGIRPPTGRATAWVRCFSRLDSRRPPPSPARTDAY